MSRFYSASHIASSMGIITSFFAIAVLSSTAIGAPLASSPPSSPALLFRQAPSSQCSFPGNSDLYGLGIRIGIYLQWLSGFLANCLSADSVHDVLATNTIFLIALFIALGIITINGTVQAVEVVILLQFCFGSLFSSNSVWGLRVRARFTSPSDFGKRVDFSLAGSATRLCLASAICFYSTWFWFSGIDKLVHGIGDPTCHPQGFLFAPVDLMHRARVFLKTASIFLAIFFGFATFSEIVLLLFNWTFYGVLSALIALLIDFHKQLHSKTPVTKAQTVFRIPVFILKYSPVVFTSIPWIIMNGKAGTGFKRLQSWLLILIVVWLIVLLLLISLWKVSSRPLIFAGKFLKSAESVRRRGTTKSKPEDRSSETGLSYTAPVPMPVVQEQNAAIQSKAIDTENPKKTSDYENDTINLSQSPFNPSGTNKVESFTDDQTYGTELHGNPNALSDDPERIKISSFAISPNETKGEPLVVPRDPSDSRSPGRLGPLVTLWTKLGESWDFSDRRSLDLLPFINLLCLSWSIIAIELMIKWNHITEVYTIQSVGQLIPFVIGIVGLFKLLRDIHVCSTELRIYHIVMESLLYFDPKEAQDSIPQRAEPPVRGEYSAALLSSKLPPDSVPPSTALGARENIGDEATVLAHAKKSTQASESQDENTIKTYQQKNKYELVTHEPSTSPRLESVQDDDILEPRLLGSNIFLFFRLIFSREERELAKSEPLLRDSIGDQMITLLQKDASSQEESAEKMNAMLALKVFSQFKSAQTGPPRSKEDTEKMRNQLLGQLHHVDVNPQTLALRWLTTYIRAWWEYFQLRLKMIRATMDREREARDGKHREAALKLKAEENDGNIEPTSNL